MHRVTLSPRLHERMIEYVREGVVGLYEPTSFVVHGHSHLVTHPELRHQDLTHMQYVASSDLRGGGGGDKVCKNLSTDWVKKTIILRPINAIGNQMRRKCSTSTVKLAHNVLRGFAAKKATVRLCPTFHVTTVAH